MQTILPPLMMTAILFSLSTTALARAEPTAMRVLSFNIRYDNPQDGQDAWRHRRDDVAQFIREQQVDVAGLQEVRATQIEDLTERLPQYAWYGVGRDDGQRQGEFVPIFYRNDRFEVLDRGVFWLSETPEQPGSKSWDAAITRVTTWLQLRDRRNEQAFFVFNTHFDHIGAEARKQSAQLLLQKVQEIAADAPVIVLGDFNATPDAPPYAILTGQDQDRSQEELIALQDAYTVAPPQPQQLDSTWNGFKAIVLGRRIDYVFTGGPLQVKQHRIMTDRTEEGRFLSDHLPVLADVQVEGSTAPR